MRGSSGVHHKFKTMNDDEDKSLEKWNCVLFGMLDGVVVFLGVSFSWDRKRFCIPKTMHHRIQLNLVPRC